MEKGNTTGLHRAVGVSIGRHLFYTEDLPLNPKMMSESIPISQNEVKISEAFNMTPAEVAVIKQNTAKGTTDMELSYFIKVCQSMQLNPFNKEVWCFKDTKGNLLIFAGRDGFLKKAQSNPAYNGLRSCEVCQNDEIELNIPLAEVHHKINPKIDRGVIIGAYAFVFRKDGEPTVEWSSFKTYNKGYNAWTTHPAEMIKKVAETHALKKSMAISGIQSEYDFMINSHGIAVPIDTTGNASDKPPLMDMAKAQRYLGNGGSIEHIESKNSITEDQRNILLKK